MIEDDASKCDERAAERSYIMTSCPCVDSATPHVDQGLTSEANMRRILGL